ERADPQSNLQISLTCPACGHCWEALFDIVFFLWAEINHWAERTLRAVHLLARAYGWREADVLAMSPTRRQMYLGMASQ
ncbi:MAG: phage baseplate protein, partial [Gammaproteobacteria bacterium]